jgi:hypothetical protein
MYTNLINLNEIGFANDSAFVDDDYVCGGACC